MITPTYQPRNPGVCLTALLTAYISGMRSIQPLTASLLFIPGVLLTHNRYKSLQLTVRYWTPAPLTVGLHNLPPCVLHSRRPFAYCQLLDHSLQAQFWQGTMTLNAVSLPNPRMPSRQFQQMVSSAVKSTTRQFQLLRNSMFHIPTALNIAVVLGSPSGTSQAHGRHPSYNLSCPLLSLA